MISFVGLALLHLAGGLLRAAATRADWRQTLRSPASIWFALIALYALSLGLIGTVLGVALFIGLRSRLTVRFAPVEVAPPSALSPGAPWALALAVLILARPWVPTSWDEFVWLAKARLESLGFGTGARLALDASAHLVPSGYPPLWPAAVGWVSLGVDSLPAQVSAASLLVLMTLATAMEAWWPRLRSTPGWLVIAVLATPLFWVHARSTYVDLPLGLLAVALLGHVLAGELAAAVVLALVLSGLKDEGLAHVLATVGAVWLVSPRREWRQLTPAVAAVLAAAGWRAAAQFGGITNEDHTLSAPLWRWLPDLGRLLAFHASDLASWGVFWAIALAVGLRSTESSTRALRLGLLLNLTLSGAALLCGPEQVRVFAESGTLLNRLLMQWWPAAAVMVLLEGRRSAQAAAPR